MESRKVGLIGLGVMGQSLALNIADKGFEVSVYNITKKVSDTFLKERVGENLSIRGYGELQEFVQSLDRPRRIIMMITAGAPVDEMIGKLKLLLDEGDVLLDGGNSYFKDTSRRMEDLNKTGIHYLGVGISGGEEGALKGPSMMPGGSIAGWNLSKDFLTAIAARCFDEVCCSYIGDAGSGHFVKMVHNGIEYADMQGIAEAYKYMSAVLKMTNEEISSVFEEWNQGPLKSYLLEITIQILLKRDPETKESLVELISDVARQKGTGKWTSKEALDLGVSIPSLTESVYVRYSSMKSDERAEAHANYENVELQKKRDLERELEDLQAALLGAKISVYSQGFALLKEASDTYQFNLNLSEIAKVWMRGCIIRADLLKDIQSIYENDPTTRNLLLDPLMIERYKVILNAWRRSVIRAVEAGIPFSVIGSALTYFDTYRSTRMSTNLIQAQRDYFGAHTYERIDREGSFHTDW